MPGKRSWKQVDGVLLLDKPLGLTSNDALQKARRLFSAAKGGHTGTLDPLATGLLPAAVPLLPMGACLGMGATRSRMNSARNSLPSDFISFW